MILLDYTDWITREYNPDPNNLQYNLYGSYYFWSNFIDILDRAANFPSVACFNFIFFNNAVYDTSNFANYTNPVRLGSATSKFTNEASAIKAITGNSLQLPAATLGAFGQALSNLRNSNEQYAGYMLIGGPTFTGNSFELQNVQSELQQLQARGLPFAQLRFAPTQPSNAASFNSWAGSSRYWFGGNQIVDQATGTTLSRFLAQYGLVPAGPFNQYYTEMLAIDVTPAPTTTTTTTLRPITPGPTTPGEATPAPPRSK